MKDDNGSAATADEKIETCVEQDGVLADPALLPGMDVADAEVEELEAGTNEPWDAQNALKAGK